MSLVVSLRPDQHDSIMEVAATGIEYMHSPLLISDTKQFDDGEPLVFLNTFADEIRAFGYVKDWIQVAPHSKLFFPVLVEVFEMFDPIKAPGCIPLDIAIMVHKDPGKDGILHNLETHHHKLDDLAECDKQSFYRYCMGHGAQQSKDARDNSDWRSEASLAMATQNAHHHG